MITSKLIINFNGNKYIIIYGGKSNDNDIYYIKVDKTGIPIMNDIVRIMEFILGVKLISKAWSERSGIKDNYSLSYDVKRKVYVFEYSGANPFTP